MKKEEIKNSISFNFGGEDVLSVKQGNDKYGNPFESLQIASVHKPDLIRLEKVLKSLSDIVHAQLVNNHGKRVFNSIFD